MSYAVCTCDENHSGQMLEENMLCGLAITWRPGNFENNNNNNDKRQTSVFYQKIGWFSDITHVSRDEFGTAEGDNNKYTSRTGLEQD